MCIYLFKTEAKRYEEEKYRLKTSLRRSEDNVAELRSNLSSAREQIYKLKEQNASYSAKISSLDSTSVVDRSLVNSTNTLLASLDDRLRSVEEWSRSRPSSPVTSPNRTQTLIVHDDERWREEKEQLHERIMKLEEDNSRLSSLRSKHEMEMKVLTDERDVLLRQHQDMYQKLIAADSKIREQEFELTSLNASSNDLSASFSKRSQSEQRRVQMLEKELAEREDEVAYLTENITSQASQLQSTYESNQQMSQELNALRREVQALRDESLNTTLDLASSEQAARNVIADTEGEYVHLRWVSRKMYAYTVLREKRKREVEQLLAEKENALQLGSDSSMSRPHSSGGSVPHEVSALRQILADEKREMDMLLQDREDLENSTFSRAEQLLAEKKRRKIFNMWRENCRFVTGRNMKLERALLLIRRRWTRNAFSHWQRQIQACQAAELANLGKIMEDSRDLHCSEQEEAKRKLLKYRMQMMDMAGESLVKKSFTRWVVFIRDRRYRKKQVTRALTTCYRSRLRAGLQRWREFLSIAREEELQEKLSQTLAEQKLSVNRMLSGVFSSHMSKSNGQILRDAFKRIARFTQARKSARRVMGRWIAQTEKHELAQALNSWKAFVSNSRLAEIEQQNYEVKAKQQQAGKQLQDTKKGILNLFYDSRRRLWQAKVFMRWRQAFMEKRVKMHTLSLSYKTTVVLRRERLRRKCFRKWLLNQRLASEKRRQREATMKRYLNRMCHIAQHQAFRQWQSFVTHCRAEDYRSRIAGTNQELVNRLNDAKRKVALTMFKSISKGSISTFFYAWKMYAKDKKHEKAVKERAEKEVGEELTRLRRSASLEMRLEDDAQQEHQKELEALRQKLLVAKRGAAQILIGRMGKTSVAPYFIAWKSYTKMAKAQKKKQALYEDSMNRLKHEFASEQDRMQQEMNHMKERVKMSILAKMQGTSVKPVFVAWRLFARQRKEQREREKEEEENMREMQSEYERENEELRAQLRAHKEKLKENILSKMTRGSIIPAFLQWKRVVQEARREREQAELEDLREERENLHSYLTETKQRAATRIIQKWQSTSISSAFKAWKQVVLDRKREKASEESVHQRIEEVKKEYEMMKQNLEGDVKRSKEKAALAVLRRWQSASVETCFAAWKLYVQHNKQKKHEEKLKRELESRLSEETDRLTLLMDKQKQKLTAHVLRQWEQRTITGVFQRWKENARGQRLEREMGAALEEAREEARREAIEELECEYTKKESSLQLRLKRTRSKARLAVVAKWRNHSVSKCFLAWHEHTLEQKRIREIMTRTLKRLEHSSKYKAWRQWTMFVEKASRDEERERFEVERKQFEAERLRYEQQASEFAQRRELMELKMEENAKRAVDLLLGRKKTLTLVRCMEMWWRHTKSMKSRKAVIDRVMERARITWLEKGFRRWHDKVLMAREEEAAANVIRTRAKATAAIFRGMQRSSEQTHFLAWKLFVQDKIRNRKEADARQEMAEEVAALRSQLGAAKQKASKELIAKFTQGSLTRTFLSWRSYVIRERARRQLEEQYESEHDRLQQVISNTKSIASRAIIAKWQNSSVASAFNAWRVVVQKSKKERLEEDAKEREMDLKKSSIIRKWKNSSLTAAWKCWTTFVQERKNMRREAALESEFQADREAMEIRLKTANEKAASALIQKWMQGSVSAAFRGWRRVVADAKVERQREELEAYKKRLEEQEESFRGEMAQHKARMGAKLISQWRHRSQVPVFKAWKQFAADSKAHKREVVERIVRRMTNLNVWHAFRLWRQQTEEGRVTDLRARFERENEELRKKLAHHKEKTGAALIRRWQHMSISNAFLTWKENASRARARKKAILDRTLKRMHNQHLWNTWRVWTSFVENSKVAELRGAIVDEKRKRGEEMIKRWRNRSLTPAFQNWKAFATQRRAHKKELMDRILRRIKNAGLYAAWRQWTRVVEHEKVEKMKQMMQDQQGKAAERFLKKWKNRSVIRCFTALRDHARENRRRKKELMDSTLKRLSQTLLYRGWRTWTQFVEQSRIDDLTSKMNEENSRLRDMMDRQKKMTADSIMKRWRNAQAARCFENWKKYARDQRLKKKQFMDQTLRRMKNAKLYSAWRVWRKNVEDERVNEMKAQFSEEREALQLETASLRQKMEAEMVALRNQVATEKRKRGEAVILQWKFRIVTPVFDAWARYARERKARRTELLKKTVLRLANAKLWSAWRIWTKNAEAGKVEDLKRQLANVSSEVERQTQLLVEHKQKAGMAIIKRWRQGSLTTTFSAWRQYAAERRAYKKQVMDRTLRRLQNGNLHAAWRTWRQRVEEDKVSAMRREFEDQMRQHKKQAADRLIHRWRHSSMIPAFEAWVKYTAERKEKKKAAMERVVKGLLHSNMLKGWRTWREFVAHEKNQEREKAQFEREQEHNMSIAKVRMSAIFSRVAGREKLLVSQVFHALRRYTLYGKRERQQEAACRVFAEQRKKRLLGTAFNTWHKSHVKRQMKFLANSNNGALLSFRRTARSSFQIFKSWYTLTMSRLRKKEVVKRCLNRQVVSAKRSVLSKWIRFTAVSRYEEHEQKLNNLRSKSLVLKLSSDANKIVVSAFLRWKVRALESKVHHYRENLEQKESLLSLTQEELDHTRTQAEQLAAAEALLSTSVQELQSALETSKQSQQELEVSFSTQYGQTTDIRLQMFIRQREKRLKTKLFLWWVTQSNRATYRRTILARLIRGKRDRLVFLALSRWRHVTEASRREEFNSSLLSMQMQNEKLLNQMAESEYDSFQGGARHTLTQFQSPRPFSPKYPAQHGHSADTSRSHTRSGGAPPSVHGVHIPDPLNSSDLHDLETIRLLIPDADEAARERERERVLREEERAKKHAEEVRRQEELHLQSQASLEKKLMSLQSSVERIAHETKDQGEYLHYMSEEQRRLTESLRKPAKSPLRKKKVVKKKKKVASGDQLTIIVPRNIGPGRHSIIVSPNSRASGTKSPTRASAMNVSSPERKPWRSVGAYFGHDHRISSRINNLTRGIEHHAVQTSASLVDLPTRLKSTDD